MKKIICLAGITLLLFSCVTNNKPVSHLLSPSNLKSQVYLIDPATNNQIRTAHGSIIKIPAGAINTESKKVQIEIKEAFTAEEIIQAGLITESNGKPLQSAGMIYINAKATDKELTLLKPVSVALPGESFDARMKIFEGEIKEDNTINWINPVQPDTTSPTQLLQGAKALFDAKCGSCHHIFFDGTGPALYGMEQRGPWRNRKNIYDFIRNPGGFMSRDSYTQNLKAKFGSMMTGFPDLDDKSIDAILFYFNSQVPASKGAFDNPCGYDTISHTIEQIPDHIRGSRADTAQYVQQQKEDFTETIIDTGYVYNDTTVYEYGDTTSIPLNIEDYQPNVYQFEINSFGWYNVDAFIEGYPGLTDIKISGTLTGLKENEQMMVYLFCPAKKFSQYAIGQYENEFDFNKNESGLPFFLNERVILFAVSTQGSEARYAIKEFITKKEQVIDLEIKTSTKNELLDKIKSIKLEGVDLSEVRTETIIVPRPCDTGTHKSVTDTTINVK